MFSLRVRTLGSERDSASDPLQFTAAAAAHPDQTRALDDFSAIRQHCPTPSSNQRRDGHARIARAAVHRCAKPRLPMMRCCAYCAMKDGVIVCRCCDADIGANLTDPMFQGQYHGKVTLVANDATSPQELATYLPCMPSRETRPAQGYHDADLPAVLARAWAAGVTRIIITATNAAEAKQALALARTDGGSAPWLTCPPT